MGNMVKIVETLKPKLDLILKTSIKINTAVLRRKISTDVYNIFSLLKPFSYKPKIACTVNDNYIVVSKNLQFSTHREYSGLPVSPEDFLDVITKHGYCIGEHVRYSIKDCFKKLVKLSREIKYYPNTTVFFEVKKPKTIRIFLMSNGRVVVKKKRVSYLSLETDNPNAIIIPNNHVLHLYGYGLLVEIEGIVDELVELYAKAEKTINRMKKHNRLVLKEMYKTVSPLVSTKK